MKSSPPNLKVEMFNNLRILVEWSGKMQELCTRNIDHKMIAFLK